MSLTEQLAADVAAYITDSDGGLSLPVEVKNERVNIRPDLATFPPTGPARVTVTPSAQAVRRAGRGVREREVTIAIAVQRRVTVVDGAPDLDEFGGLAQLAEEIVDLFDPGPPFSGNDQSQGQWMETAQPVLFAQDHLDNHQLYTSVITVTYIIHPQ